jgi:hypothetical protein
MKSQVQYRKTQLSLLLIHLSPVSAGQAGAPVGRRQRDSLVRGGQSPETWCMEGAPDRPDRGGALEVSSTEPAQPYLAGCSP